MDAERELDGSKGCVLEHHASAGKRVYSSTQVSGFDLYRELFKS